MSEERSFEKILKDIEVQVSKLEKGNMPLEEAIESYKQGVATIAELRSRLDDAIVQISEIQVHLAENEEFDS